MKVFKISGFADEAAVSLEDQIGVFKLNGINAIEMRSVNGKSIVDMTDAELSAIKNALDLEGFVVSAIGSPIGKSEITDPFENELKRFARAVNAAKKLDCPYIRMFSFYPPQGRNPNDYTDEVIKRINVLTRIAEDEGLVLGLENESRLFGDIPERLEIIFNAIQSPALRFVFDPSNFIRDNVKPYPQAYNALKKYLLYFHIKDGSPDAGHALPAGEGTGSIAEMLKEAYADGFDNWLSIEPHLSYNEDWSKARQFTEAANALRRVLTYVI